MSSHADISRRAPEPSRARREAPRRSPRRRPVILIADDTTDTRELYAEHFRTRGFTVVTAHDGAAAVQVACEHAPDVIVMDLAMPQLPALRVKNVWGYLSLTRTRIVDPHRYLSSKCIR